MYGMILRKKFHAFGNGTDLLAEILLNDEDEDVRMSAADALGDIGEDIDVSAIRALEGALSDEDEDVRMSAADALGDIGSEIAIDSLRETLQDEDVEVKESAVIALGSIGGVRAVLALKGALSDEDEDVRELAVKELSWIDESEPMIDTPEESSLESLSEDLYDEDMDILEEDMLEPLEE